MTADAGGVGAPRFDVVLRGYDRRQVDEHVARLQRVVSRMRADLEMVRSQPFPAVQAPPPGYGGPGPGQGPGRSPRPTPRPRPDEPDMIGSFTDRMQSILQAAEEEAAEIRNKARAGARAEADSVRAEVADLVRQRDAVLAELTRLRGQLHGVLGGPTAQMTAAPRDGGASGRPAKPGAPGASKPGQPSGPERPGPPRPRPTPSPTGQSQPAGQPPGVGQPGVPQPASAQANTPRPSSPAASGPPSGAPSAQQQPSTQQPSTQQPSTQQPSTQQPITRQPAAAPSTPSTPRPASAQPSASPKPPQPSASQPRSSQPRTSQPRTSQAAGQQVPAGQPKAQPPNVTNVPPAGGEARQNGSPSQGANGSVPQNGAPRGTAVNPGSSVPRAGESRPPAPDVGKAAHRLPTGAYPAVEGEQPSMRPRSEPEPEPGDLFRPPAPQGRDAKPVEPPGRPAQKPGDVEATMKVGLVRPVAAPSDRTVLSPAVSHAEKEDAGKDAPSDAKRPDGDGPAGPGHPDRSTSTSRSG